MYFLGIDFGTSGARAQVIDLEGQVVAQDSRAFPAVDPFDLAATWRDALWDLIAALPRSLRSRLAALAVDATSGTVIACDEALDPRAPPILYDDARASEEARLIARTATPGHPAAAATSGLAKVLWLKKRLGITGARLYVNQADWLSGLVTGRVGMTDYHNALKMGLDLDELAWPQWVEYLADVDYLPVPIMPGETLGTVSPSRARYLGIATDCIVRAGTTDSIAAFLAAEVHDTGMGVTSLGSTLVVKLLSERRVESTEHGVYSHWFGDRWLAGGASNAGGAVLRQFFDDARLAQLSAWIDARHPSPLEYVPLTRPGERFPVNDPTLAPRLEPRPADDVAFLHGLLESLAGIEAHGYALLEALGAPAVAAVKTAGRGAHNEAWTAIRQRRLGVPVSASRHTEAAYGAALLARDGVAVFA